MKTRATRGAWNGETDRWHGAQRLAFARWLVEHARIGAGDLEAAYPLLTSADFSTDEAAAPSGEGQGGGVSG